MIKVDHAALSEQGPVRGKNEDSIAFMIPTDSDLLAVKGCLFVVADGVGGHGAGDVASSTAVKMLIDLYYQGHQKPERALKSAFSTINLKIFDMGVETNRFRMQTTMSALALVGNTYTICHIGDSRIYRMRPLTEIEQLTTDHSEVGELMRLGIISADKIRTHPRRSFITRSIGGQTAVQAMTRTGEVRDDDMFVLCTDGVWEPVEESDMQRILTSMTPEEACHEMVKLGIERDVRDNLSIQILKVLSVPEGQSRVTITTQGGLMARLMDFFGRK